MTGVFETDDGTQYHTDELERKEKCDFCGKLGEVQGEDDFIDGQLLSLMNESHDSADICRNCIVEGVDQDKLQEELSTKEEILKERQEREVELS